MMSYEKSIKDMSEKINSLTEENRELKLSIAEKNINLEKKIKNMDAGAAGFVKKINLVEKWKQNEFKKVFGQVKDLQKEQVKLANTQKEQLKLINAKP